MPFTSCSRGSGAPKTAACEPKRSSSALAIGLVSRRGDQPEQQQLEQLVIGEGCIAMLTEAVAQALAVPVVVLFLAKRGGEAGLLRQGCRLGGLFREKERSSLASLVAKGSSASLECETGPFVIKRSSVQGREAGSVEAAWRKRENLAAVGSNPDRVFVLRRK
jgi:hypothetical protein